MRGAKKDKRPLTNTGLITRFPVPIRWQQQQMILVSLWLFWMVVRSTISRWRNDINSLCSLAYWSDCFMYVGWNKYHSCIFKRGAVQRGFYRRYNNIVLQNCLHIQKKYSENTLLIISLLFEEVHLFLLVSHFCFIVRCHETVWGLFSASQLSCEAKYGSSSNWRGSYQGQTNFHCARVID